MRDPILGEEAVTFGLGLALICALALAMGCAAWVGWELAQGHQANQVIETGKTARDLKVKIDSLEQVAVTLRRECRRR